MFSDREHLVDSRDVLRLVELSACSAYDCEFVALAEYLKAPLVTNDREVLASFSDVAVSMEGFVGDAVDPES